jgi:filamentous hemagglutinin family protein
LEVGSGRERRHEVGGNGDGVRRARLICVGVLSSLFIAAPCAFAGPAGGNVVAGQASISAAGTQTLIRQGSDKAVINWNSYSLAPNESAIYQQPGAGSIALNRVLGGQPSQILGSIRANGQVWLVNPNGVFFGRGATVNVAGLLATTADIGNSDFLAGNYNFGTPSSNPNAAIVNNGTITAANGGSVVLAAPSVDNEGVIEARLGSVTLGAGKTFAVDFDGDNLLSFAITSADSQVPLGPDGKPVSALVKNAGSLKADGGTVQVTARAAGAIVDNVINTTGIVEANSVAVKNGTVILSGTGGGVTVGGTVSAAGKTAGTTGGTVKVLGDGVTLASGANIDVSGAAGGGTALIGGDFHGAGPDANAATTTIAQNARSDANATQTGNGGEVAVWSEDDTTFDGTISARGGPAGGNGGYVETSGAGSLAVGGFVDTLAPLGVIGNWLLDPANITVAASGGAALIGFGSYGGDSGASDSISASTIDNASSNVTLQATNQIEFQVPVSMAKSNVGLTADADTILLDSGSGIATKGGAITLAANALGSNQSGTGTLQLGANLASAGGAISLSGPTVLTGNVAINTVTGAPNGGAGVTFAGTLDDSSLFVHGLTIAAGVGNVTFDQRVGHNNPVTVNCGGAGQAACGVAAGTSPGDVTISSAGNVNLDMPYGGSNKNGFSAKSLSVTATGSFTVSQAYLSTFNPLGSGGNITINNGGNVSIYGQVNTGGGASGGNGGAVNITAGGAVSIFYCCTLSQFGTTGTGDEQIPNTIGVYAAGYSPATATELAGNGGVVNITGTSINLPLGLNTNGGDAVVSGSTAGGGNAGWVNLTATTGNVAIGDAPDNGNLTGIYARGGNSLAGSGGSAGVVNITANNQISLSRILADGGSTGATSGAGTGGNVVLVAHAASGPAVTLYGEAESAQTSFTALGTIEAFGGENGVTFSGTDNLFHTGGTLGNSGLGIFIASTNNGNPSGYIQLVDDSAASQYGGGATIYIGGSAMSSQATANILIGNPIEGTSPGAEALRIRNLYVGNVTGIVGVVGGMGDQVPLGYVSLAGGTVALDGNIVTEAGKLANFQLCSGSPYSCASMTPSYAGDVNLTGGAALYQNVTIDTTGGGSVPGSNITVNGTIDGSGAGGQALILRANDTPLADLATPGDCCGNPGQATPSTDGGVVTLKGDVGGTLALGSLEMTGSALDIGGNITTSGGQISAFGPMVLTKSGFTTFATGGGDVNLFYDNTVDGTAAGAQSLTVETSGGAIDFPVIGGLVPLGGLTTDGGANLHGNVTTAGGMIAFGGAVTTFTNLVLDTTGNNTPTGAAIAVDGTIEPGNPGITLALNGGTSGVLSLGQNVGDNTSYGSFSDIGLTGGGIALAGSLSATGTLTLNAGIGAIADAGALKVGSFVLEGGNWIQLASTLPAFSATDFELPGGTFLRALGGNGSGANPYEITDIYGLQGIATLPADNFALANNIDATATAGWNSGRGFIPIGNATTPFTGIFTGGGFTVSGLAINSPLASVGLFGDVGTGGFVQNVALTNAVVATSGNGASAGILVGINDGTVSNSSATGTLTGTADATNLGGDANLGGLVGFNDSGAVNGHSFANVAIIDNANYSGDSLGGLVGRNNGTIEQTYANGSVTVNAQAAIDYGGPNAGGLVGYQIGGGIDQSFSTGMVLNNNQTGAPNTGGLVGWEQAGTITNSYSSSPVISYVGAAGADYLGGLVGWQTGGSVASSYSIGLVQCGVSNGCVAGGLIGVGGGSVDNLSFWDMNTSGQSTSSGGLGLTTAQAQSQGYLASLGWNFAPGSVVATQSGTSYPYLVWYGGPPVAEEIVSGTAPDNATVDLLVNGLSPQTTTAAGNGVYDFFLTIGTTGAALVYLPGGAANAVSELAPSGATGLTLTTTNSVYLTGQGGTVATSDLVSAKGGASGGSILYGVSGTSIMLNPGVALDIVGGTGSVVIDDAIAGAGGNIGISGTSIALGNDITTAGGITFGGPVTLTAAANLTSSGTGGILFQNTVDGAFGLNIATGGGITFSGNVGGASPLGQVSLSAPTVLAQGGFAATSIDDPAAISSATFDGQVSVGSLTMTENPVATSLTMLGGATFGTSFNPNSAALTVAGTFTFASTYLSNFLINHPFTVAGGGATLDESATSRPIVLSAAIDGSGVGGQTLTIDAGNNSFTSTAAGIIGGTVPLATVTINGGAISLGAPISTYGGAVSITGASIALGANILTHNGAITLDSLGGALGGDITLAGAGVTLDTTAVNGDPGNAAGTGAPVVLDGTVNSTSAANPTALQINAGESSISLPDAVGGQFPLGALGLHAGVIDLGGNITTAAGTVTINGITLFTNDTTIATTGNGQVAGADINVDIGGTAATDPTLTFDAGQSQVNGIVNFGTGYLIALAAGSSVLTGTVNGVTGAGAAALVSVTENGAGPFTFNGVADGTASPPPPPPPPTPTPSPTPANQPGPAQTLTQSTPLNAIGGNLFVAPLPPLPTPSPTIVLIETNPVPEQASLTLPSAETPDSVGGLDTGAAMFQTISPTAGSDLLASPRSNATLSSFANPPPVKPAAHATAPPPVVSRPVAAYLDQMLTPAVPRPGVPGISFGYSLSGNSATW